jgi:hypothetical protein
MNEIKIRVCVSEIYTCTFIFLCADFLEKQRDIEIPKTDAHTRSHRECAMCGYFVVMRSVI